MESLLSLAPLLSELLSKINASPSAAPAPQPLGSDILPGDRSDVRMVAPPKLPPAPRSIHSSPPLASPYVDLPFQFIFYDLTNAETGFTSLDLASKPPFLSLTSPYAYAVLQSLELTVFPKNPSYTYPMSFDAHWHSSSVSITGSQILSTYGGTRVTFGGPITSSNPIILPADLRSTNPVVKDTVSYNNTPKLTVAFHKNTDAPAVSVTTPVIYGSIVIRGVVRCSSVRATPYPVA
nr:25kDa coat protein [Grapevine Red Globe virus]